jgi:hypothetical protein
MRFNLKGKNEKKSHAMRIINSAALDSLSMEVKDSYELSNHLTD